MFELRNTQSYRDTLLLMKNFITLNLRKLQKGKIGSGSGIKKLMTKADNFSHFETFLKKSLEKAHQTKNLFVLTSTGSATQNKIKQMQY